MLPATKPRCAAYWFSNGTAQGCTLSARACPPGIEPRSLDHNAPPRMQSSFLDAPAAQAQSFTFDTVKSWQSFRDYLEDARKM